MPHYIAGCESGMTSLTLTLTSIHPASTWMHWTTLRRHSCLLRAADWASSQASPIFSKPGTSQYNTCCGGCWWSICSTCPNQWSLHSVRMLSLVRCPVLPSISSFVSSSLQEMPNMLLCRLWWAVSSLFLNIDVRGNNSALYKRVERTILLVQSCLNFQADIVVSPNLFQFFPNTDTAFPMRTLTSFSQLWKNCTICRCQGSRSRWPVRYPILLPGYLICRPKH